MMRLVACAALLLLFNASTWAEDVALRWSWAGSGTFPRTVTLSIENLHGQEMVLLEEWSELRSVDGWGEMQRSHRLVVGSVRHVGDRRFIVLSDRQQSAEIILKDGGALQLRWFGLGTSSPADSDLLAPAAMPAPSEWPDLMLPDGTGTTPPRLGL